MKRLSIISAAIGILVATSGCTTQEWGNLGYALGSPGYYGSCGYNRCASRYNYNNSYYYNGRGGYDRGHHDGYRHDRRGHGYRDRRGHGHGEGRGRGRGRGRGG